MKAIACTAYGPPDVLQLQEVEKPTPKDNQVLIKVHAATVNIGDCRVRSFDVPLPFWLLYRFQIGLARPKLPILGSVVAGEIEAVGKDVTRFKVGDQVYGLDTTVMGAHAQYTCRSEGGALAIKPANMTYEQAAAVPHGAMTALFFLRDKAKVQPGQKVLINGASGAVGTWAVQVAKALGAEVTGVCSEANLDLVRSLGADAVIDYTRQDFTTSGATYDVIFDAVSKTSYRRCKNSLAPNGVYLVTDPKLGAVLSMLWTSMVGTKKAIFAVGSETSESLEHLTGLIEAGKIRSVIDAVYPLDQIPKAHAYVQKGHAKGNIVITIEHGS